jgi:LysM repeat protein
MSLIIKEYIDLIVEKIYSVDKKNQFKLNDLKSLNNLRDIQDYTRNKLKKLGEGTAREVYLLNTGKVLKIALDRYDTEQNEGEVFASARFGDLVPSVYEWDPNYNWIITELVKPLENNPESENIFKLKSGLSFNDYDDFIKYHSFGTKSPNLAEANTSPSFCSVSYLSNAIFNTLPVFNKYTSLAVPSPSFFNLFLV